MNNEKTVNSTIKDSTVKATPKKKKMKEVNMMEDGSSSTVPVRRRTAPLCFCAIMRLL